MVCGAVWQIEETLAFHIPEPSGKFHVGSQQQQICKCCRKWYAAAGECGRCMLDARQVVISWNPWLWAIMHMVHNLLRATYRERRGVANLFTVPVAVGFALLRHFARVRPAVHREPYYTPSHPSWKQGTSKGGAWHFIKFAYDDMDHVEWGFPLHDYFKKTDSGPVRLVSKKMWQDLRVWATPVQFKFKWAAEKSLGVPVPGVSTFSVSANITHIGKANAAERWNTEYLRWTAEQQQSQVVCAKAAVASFPRVPLRATHLLKNQRHPLQEWAASFTPLPSAPECAADKSGGDNGGNSDDSKDSDSSLSSGSDAADCS